MPISHEVELLYEAYSQEFIRAARLFNFSQLKFQYGKLHEKKWLKNDSVANILDRKAFDMMKTIAFLAAVFPIAATAGVCEYRPSNLIGGGGAGAAAATAGGVDAAGTAAKAAGFYTLTHAVTGATMLGSAAGGASAAGTVGIMGGTAGVIGTAASIIMAPAVIIGGAIVGGGIAIYEG